VLLDEPTAGLDPMNALQIRQLIARMAEQATFVISSHNLFELEKLCGTILYLEHGKLVQQRTLNTKIHQGFLTLTLEQGDATQVLKELALVSGVHKVDSAQKNEYLIWFDADLAPDTDLAVLQMLRTHGWRYKSLQRGQSLEQQLFAVANG
jgi:ABC-2 type transport system ATP-binding protein